jgi:acyl-CoA synthetase (AMP-forming)/AMP-acid ligase II
VTKIVDDQRREVPVGQVGELAHRLPSLMLGYHNAPELTAGALDPEGWYYTGDLAVRDEKGFIRVVGRKKDMVIRGGQNIYPAEIEQFLTAQEGVKNAAAIGRPHPVLGECLWLYVELQEGAVCSAESLMALCRARLSPSKRPDYVKIVDSLPVTASGKVKKYLLKEMDRLHER